MYVPQQVNQIFLILLLSLTQTSYYQLLYAFESTSGSISDLYNMINSVASDCSDPTLLGNFIENHDNPRFASYDPPSFVVYIFFFCFRH